MFADFFILIIGKETRGLQENYEGSLGEGTQEN